MPVDAPPPPSFSVRPATLDDVDVITALMAESAQAAIGQDDVTTEEVREGLARPYLDLARDTFCMRDGSGRLVGYGAVEDEHPERAYADVYVSPALPPADFRQIGAWLAGRCVDRAEELVVASGRSGVELGAGCYRQEPAVAEVLRQAGFQRVRTFWRMSVDLDDVHLAPAPLPSDITVRTIDPDDADDASVAHRVETSAFRGHFGSLEYTVERYWQDQRARGAFDPSQWWLAEVGGAAAGLAYGDNRRRDEGVGWVRILGVLPEYRGRGIGTVLLQHAFAEFRRRGRDRAMLAVDSENETGATRLYESVGMTPVLIIDTYQLALPR